MNKSDPSAQDTRSDHRPQRQSERGERQNHPVADRLIETGSSTRSGEPTGAEFSSSLALRLPGSQLAFRGGSVESQVAMLQQLNGAQRQSMLQQIGRAQGNRHVQKLLGSLPSAEATQTPQPGAFQNDQNAETQVPGGEHAGLFPPAPAVAESSSELLDTVAVTPPTRVALMLEQMRPRIVAQQQEAREFFNAQWKDLPNPAWTLMGALEPQANDASQTLSVAEPAVAEPAVAEPAKEEVEAVHVEHGKFQDKDGPANDQTSISASAGPRPQVPLVGQADPRLVQQDQQSNLLTVKTARAQMDAAAHADFGERVMRPTALPQSLDVTTWTTPVKADQQTSLLLQGSQSPPVQELPGSLRDMVDRMMSPQVAARAQELKAKQQQYRAAYQERARTLQVQGQQHLAQVTQQARMEQRNVRQQAEAEVGAVRQEWLAENRRVEAKHNAQAAAMSAAVEQQIRQIVTAHEQRSDQTLTQAERRAEAERSRAESEAARVRENAHREARQVARQKSGGGAPQQQQDPVARAEALIAEIIGRMRAEVTRLLIEGRVQAGRQIAEGQNLVGQAIKELRAQLQAALDEILREYPLLMLWAEMKINQVLDRATASLNRLVATVNASSMNVYAFVQYGLGSMFSSYQSDCLNLLNRARRIGENGLDAAETRMMVEELSAFMKEKLKAGDRDFVNNQRDRIHTLLAGYGVTLSGETANQTWEYAESLVVLTAVDQINHRLAQEYEVWVRGEAQRVARQAYGQYMAQTRGQGSRYEDFAPGFVENYVNRRLHDPAGRTMFERVYGKTDFKRMGSAADGYWADTSWYSTNREIRFYSNAFTDSSGYGNGNFKAVQNAIHELGHVFEWRASNLQDPRVPRSELQKRWEQDEVHRRTPQTDPSRFPRRDDPTNNKDDQDKYYPDSGFAGPFLGWQQSKSTTAGEEFADMFLGWAYDEWARDATGGLTQAGRIRSDWMDAHMPGWINAAVRS